MFQRNTNKKNDYLKYWRVVRRLVKVKYGLGLAEMEMILFLHSEQYFGRDKFQEFNELLSWDNRRFNNLVKNGWIEKFRANTKNKKALYQLSYKATRLVNQIYDILNGDAEIPDNDRTNPMFKNDPAFFDKVYRNFIKNITRSIVRRQRPSQR